VSGLRCRLLWLALPVLMGAQCPGVDHQDLWVVVDVLTAGVESANQPLAQTQMVQVRFRTETASQDLDLVEADTLDAGIFAPLVSQTEHDGDRALVSRDATLFFESREFDRRFTVHADSGSVESELVQPGRYLMSAIPDEYTYRYAIAYEEVDIPGTDLSEVVLPWGYRLNAQVIEYDITNLAEPQIGLSDMEVEAFAEVGPGEVRRAGPRDTTDDGELELYLPEGTYTLRISSRNDADSAYPVGLITGFQVPEDIDALEAEAEELGEDLPVLYSYPKFERRSLAGRLLSTGILGGGTPEGNAAVVAWGLVEAPPEYAGREEVDFTSGSIRVRVYSTDTGDFHFGEVGLPAAVFSLDVVPGYYSDSSAQRWTGEQALDLTDASLQMGDISLDARVHMYVRVEDAQGAEVEDARVEAQNLGLSGYVTALTTGTLTNADAPGTVRLYLEQELHRVTVVPPADSDLARASFDVEVGPSTPPTVVQLEQGIHVSGQVSMRGLLQGGVQVRFSDPWDGAVLGVGTARSSGTYELRVPTSWVWPADEDGGDDDSAR